MLPHLFSQYTNIFFFTGLILAFLLTCIFLQLFKNILPRDGGRQFAVNGTLSQGKPRGAGIVFILSYILFSFLFVSFEREYIIYYILIAASMMSGFLDDSSNKPWNEYKKAIIDFIVSLAVAITFYNFNSSVMNIYIFNAEITVSPVLFIILATILIWVSINVTNCTDGVDGLSGCISIVSIISIYIIYVITGQTDNVCGQTALVMVVCILGYLWFNASPSRLLMGDAGSRAIGLFIALLILKTGSPLLYLPIAAVFILDGGLGLVKVSLLRFLKISILKKVRTPLHDHYRKNKGWSDTQTVFRFTIVQILISSIIISLIYILY